MRSPWVLVLAGSLVLTGRPAQAQEAVTFPTSDGGLIHAHVYGAGGQAVVLAHGGRWNKESWAPQARELAAAGFRVLALDFRGYGHSTGPGQADPLSAPLHQDVLAAAGYLRSQGVSSVSVVGASMGGSAAADAAVAAPGAFSRLVLLGSQAGKTPDRLALPKLFIIAANDTTASGTPRLVRIREQYDTAPEPKELLVLDGTAHAQALFATDQGARAMQAIVAFLQP